VSLLVEGRPTTAARRRGSRARRAAIAFRRDPRIRRALTRTAGGHGHPGFCPICHRWTVFVALEDWLRDSYLCLRCWSLPRQRALIAVLDEVAPDWRRLRIHEFAPSGPASVRLRDAPGYTASHFWPDVPPGGERDGDRCEDLERLTFADASLELVVTQDVFEHVLDPGRAFSEIARVLRPGGRHVFTVPYRPGERTVVRARPAVDGIEYLEPPDFHGDPVDPAGALVVSEWGADLPGFVAAHGGLATTVHHRRDRRRGLDGPFLDVLVSRKPPDPT
jgi:methyltransferase family protein